MTYIITPKHKAYRVSNNPTFDIEHLVNNMIMTKSHISAYYVTMDLHHISPIFSVYGDDDVAEYTSDECEDAQTNTEYLAVQWLCDLLERLERNPAVIHCVEDGEMFLYPSSLQRR